MKNKRNIPKAFISFLITSLLIWMLINLSKEYTSVVSYTINYEALPQNKILQEKPLETIDLLLKGSGFRLFSEKFSNKKIRLDTRKLRQKTKNNFYLLPNNHKQAIQEQLPSGLQFVEVLQDSIHLKIGSLATKKIPVIADINLHFQPGYNLLETVVIQPDSITIFGSELQLDKIKNIAITQLELENISKNFRQEVALQLPNTIENIRFSHQKVTLIGKVDKFTEGKFELPFSVINIPVGVDLNTFPKKIKLTYKVGLKDFNNVKMNSFTVVCDYKKVAENDVNYLVPKVTVKPGVVYSVKIEPNKIDFLIHK